LCSFARVGPRFVQNRCYARTGWDREIRRFCRTRGVVYQGFSLLTANRREFAHAAVTRIAARHRASPAAVVFAMAARLGMLPLTGTSSREHLREDLAALDLPLDPDELSALENVAG
jgi:diketogulonate reductase-like aldo/keto reductase